MIGGAYWAELRPKKYSRKKGTPEMLTERIGYKVLRSGGGEKVGDRRLGDPITRKTPH